MPSHASSLLPRRRALRQIATFSAWAASALVGQAGAQTSGSTAAASPLGARPDSASAEQWRALSRLGYGPTPGLLREIQAASSPRGWALQQVERAWLASQTAPSMAGDVRDINAPLAQLVSSAQTERQLRTALRSAAATAPGEAAPGDASMAMAAGAGANAGRDTRRPRMDFSAPTAPQDFGRSMAEKTAVWRLQACSQPEQENLLLARMTEFWFNHLNVYIGKVPVRPYVGHYLINVARAHALGKFEELLLASARHPAMLHYLDQNQSVADGSRGREGSTRGLNENYARELMELHTLGVNGGYTQTDVRELARVLTGWTVGPDSSDGFRFVTRSHDAGSKTVLGHRYPEGFLGRGEAEGEQAIRMLARRPETAQRLSLRLAQFFVADQPSPALVQRLSQVFLQSQGDTRLWLQTLLQSNEFWDPANRLFKTPLDFACSALTATQGAQERRNLLQTIGFLSSAGQPLHGWQTPDGYKTDAATWLAPEALTRRADYALGLGQANAELEFLLPFLGAATRTAIAQQPPGQRNGLMLASPEFMYK